MDQAHQAQAVVVAVQVLLAQLPQRVLAAQVVRAHPTLFQVLR